jgi:tRNA-uridine 2-sulfurtransferase
LGLPQMGMNKGSNVAVAMSGGVDSSVAAALLQESGQRIVGVTMRLWREPSAIDVAGELGGPDDIAAAGAVCAHLSIPHHIIDAREIMARQVIDYFVDEYTRGRTPNPCVRCNQQIKFGWLLDQVRAMGLERLATGHYARILRRGGEWQLLRGLDRHKDQSYFLSRLGQQELSRALFPLGAWTKEQVREWARQRRLPVAQRSESQDICFLAAKNYREFLRQRVPQALTPGPIYDRQERLLGEHQGLAAYTVGQREGLGISAPQPLYVIALDPARNALIVGFRKELGRDALLAGEMSYIAGEPPEPGAELTCKIRYQARPAPARIWPLEGDRARIVFAQPLRDITPGQTAALYRGEVVVGGGTIEQSYCTTEA